MLDALLKRVKCKKTYLRKSDMTSGNAYRVTLSHNGETCSFIFNDNFENKSTKRDFLYCLYLDAMCYDSTRDVYAFANEYGYGYERMSEARKAYHACEDQYTRLHRLFNRAEIELLSTIE